AVKKEQDVALVVFGCFHSGAPPCLNRVSPCGGGGALRPGAASAGFGVEDSGSFVAGSAAGPAASALAPGAAGGAGGHPPRRPDDRWDWGPRTGGGPAA